MKYFEFLEKVHKKSISFASQLSFNKKYQRHLYLISLYCRIIELTDSCMVLIEKKIISGVPIILRTILETFADFRSLSEDENYVDFMQASHINEWLRVFKEAKTGINPYLEKISQMKNLSQVYDDYNAELTKLKDEGYSPLHHYQRFDKARMESEYRSIYNFLCSHGHSNIRSLYGRYTEISGNDFTVVCYKEPEQHDIDLYSTTLCDILISTSLCIHQYFDTTALIDMEKISEEWEDIKSKHKNV